MSEYLDTLRNDIPIGRNNAIKKAELCKRWKCDEREVRRLVALLRTEPSNDECVVLSSSNTGGYWRSADPVEIRLFIAEMSARGRHTFQALKNAKKVLNVLEAQEA